MSRQRSLQKGLYTDAGDHSTGRLQVGQLTTVGIETGAPAQAQQVKRKGTSTST
jgi:hypothetical protein